MPIARPESQEDFRVIAHVDMDCFYVQVEQRRRPDLRGIPTAVVQYNSWKGGGLIAVGYEARKYGVKRSMRGDEAKKVCPDIQLIQVPVSRGKADLNLYRDAGSEVVSVLARKGRCERASIDEVYLDLTDAARTMLLENPPEDLNALDEEAINSRIIGIHKDDKNMEDFVKQWLCRTDANYNDKLLACGAIIVASLRKEVLRVTTFTCSAGIAHNKMLAKLASVMHKPAQQTIVPLSSVNELLASLPIKKMKHLGGKLGNSVESDLGVHFVGDLLQFPEEKLQALYGINTGSWLWNTARGINGEEVKERLLPMSHGSGKTFPGPKALKSVSEVQNWLNELCEELSERIESDLEQNQRVAHTLTLHARGSMSNLETEKKFPSKSCPLRYGAKKIQEDAMKLFSSGLSEYIGSHCSTKSQKQDCSYWAITTLSVSASNILAVPSGVKPITKYFHGCNSTRSNAERSSGVSQESKHEPSSSSLNSVKDDGDGAYQIEEEAHTSLETIDNDNIKSCKVSTNHTNNSWRYSLDEIDPAVLKELPVEIRQEICDELHRHEREHAKKAKRGSSIAHYFLPVKKK